MVYYGFSFDLFFLRKFKDSMNVIQRVQKKSIILFSISLNVSLCFDKYSYLSSILSGRFDRRAKQSFSCGQKILKKEK